VSKGGSRVTEQSMTALETAAELIGIDSDELQQSLLSRVMQTSKGGHKVNTIIYNKTKQSLNEFFVKNRAQYIWFHLRYTKHKTRGTHWQKPCIQSCSTL